MTRFSLPALLFTLSVVSAAAAQGPSTSVPLATTDEQASYAIGVNVGRDLKAKFPTINVAALIMGLQDGFSGQRLKLSDEQAQAAIDDFWKRTQAKQEADQRAAAARNREVGAAFLAQNSRKPGVKTLPSGLQYSVIKSGNGATPKVTDTVLTHYHGTLVDGTVFDSSVQRGEPLELQVNGVIRGWTEALQRMKVGDKWKLFIPSKLAYGSRGSAPVIGPDAVLIFEIELLDIR